MIRGSIALMLTAIVISSSHAEVTKVTVFTSGTDGYHTYRIPAIVKARNGDLLAFAEGRKNGRDDHGDIDIVMKRSTDNGRTWGQMQVVQDEWSDPAASITIGNPAPVVDLLHPTKPGRIWLPFTRDNDRVFVTYSDDDGDTWSDRREITATAKDRDWTWYATGPVHGIQLERGKHAGRLIIPADHAKGNKDWWGAHILYSDDHGATWRIGAVDTREVPGPIHPNECVAVELVDGRVYVNARDQHGLNPATRAVSYSRDGGQTFDAPFAPEPQITTPVVQNSVLRFRAIDQGDDENVLIHSGPGQASSRSDITIRASFDEGKTWSPWARIHAGPAAYSDLVKLSNDEIGVLFEAGKTLYERILFARFNFDELDRDSFRHQVNE